MVQLKIWIGSRSIILKTPIVKQKLAKSCALNSFQELLWNDLIGVDIRAIERGNDALVNSEFLHVNVKGLRSVRC